MHILRLRTEGIKCSIRKLSGTRRSIYFGSLQSKRTLYSVSRILLVRCAHFLRPGSEWSQSRPSCKGLIHISVLPSIYIYFPPCWASKDCVGSRCLCNIFTVMYPQDFQPFLSLSFAYCLAHHSLLVPM